MEPDFIAELERTFTNVGTDVFWKKKIGKLEIWLSPLSVTGQERVTAALEKATQGVNIVGESKRITLANTIVGVNGSDLREFRNGPLSFPSKNREGKPVNVTLEKYLYDKMAGWSTDYLDDVFSVYADLMESFQKQNLSGVTFENAKDPHLELLELERKASALRAQLGLPPLVEKASSEAQKGPDLEPSPEDIAEAIAEEERLSKQGTETQEDFNPFKPIQPQAEPQPEAPAPVSQPVAAARQPPPSPPPQPSMTMPAVLPPNLRRPLPGAAQESSPDRPHIATPSVANEVIEKPAEKPTGRPQIDQAQGHINPRFSQPNRP